MKSFAVFLMTTFGIFSYSQEKVFTADYRNMLTSRYCWYTKHDNKPFNGYIKFKSEDAGNSHYSKIENGCHQTVFEEINSKNELLFRGKYPYDKTNDQIVSYELDSVNLGKSELLDKELTDTVTLKKIRIFNYYNTEFINNVEIVTPINGIIYSNEDGEIYSIHYKNSIAVKLVTYYHHKDFDSTSKNIPKLQKKESHELLINENGTVSDDSLKDKEYPFIFAGEYIKWDEKGHIVEKNYIR